MVYSKKITDLTQIYALTPEDVFYCMLVAAGATRSEAYAIIFRPRSAKQEAAAKGATTLAKNKPNINRLIDVLAKEREAFTAGNVAPASDEEINETKRRRKRKEEEGGGNVMRFRDKSSVLSGLEATLPALHGKDRADVLMKIADLQQMKKDENTQEEEKVHYYLPLRCYDCELYKKKRE